MIILKVWNFIKFKLFNFRIKKLNKKKFLNLLFLFERTEASIKFFTFINPFFIAKLLAVSPDLHSTFMFTP